MSVVTVSGVMLTPLSVLYPMHDLYSNYALMECLRKDAFLLGRYELVHIAGGHDVHDRPFSLCVRPRNVVLD